MDLVDYHTHTTLSPDSTITLDVLCQTAIGLGLREVCVTDHWNLVSQEGEVTLVPFPWQPSLEQWTAARERYASRLELRLGLEVGNGLLDDGLVIQTLSLPQLDFAIGSIHNLSETYDRQGAYTLAHRVSTRDEGIALLNDYMESLLALSRTDGFDVMGHIIYPLRYLPPALGLTLEPWRDTLAQLLRNLIQAGKGIEFNTKGGVVEDYAGLLELYRDLGGRILTFGSDAHRANRLGDRLADAYALAREKGFQYYTVYRNRKPCFRPL